MNDIIFKTLLLKGEAGNNIIDIKKTSSDGLVDTYTITRTDGVITTFNVTNGKNIINIKKTGSAGLVDNYTINYNDGTSSTFSIGNGRGISGIKKTGSTGLVDTYTTTYNDGTTSTFTVTNGEGVQNLQIGGRNLLTGTRDFSGQWLNGDLWAETSEKYNGLTVRKSTKEWGGLSTEYAIEQGETYTFSIWVKKLKLSDTSKVTIFIDLNAHVTEPDTLEISVDSEWKRYSITFIGVINGNVYPRVEVNKNAKDAIAICGHKLERGNIATDWTPAPEDLIDTSITNSDIDTILNS